jgi:hypothetical protein
MLGLPTTFLGGKNMGSLFLIGYLLAPPFTF